MKTNKQKHGKAQIKYLSLSNVFAFSVFCNENKAVKNPNTAHHLFGQQKTT